MVLVIAFGIITALGIIAMLKRLPEILVVLAILYAIGYFFGGS